MCKPTKMSIDSHGGGDGGVRGDAAEASSSSSAQEGGVRGGEAHAMLGKAGSFLRRPFRTKRSAESIRQELLRDLEGGDDDDLSPEGRKKYATGSWSAALARARNSPSLKWRIARGFFAIAIVIHVLVPAWMVYTNRGFSLLGGGERAAVEDPSLVRVARPTLAPRGAAVVPEDGVEESQRVGPRLDEQPPVRARAAKRPPRTSNPHYVYGVDSCAAHPLTVTMPHTEWGCDELKEIWEETDLEMIGEGFWRDVYKGEYRGKRIVLKKMKDDHSHSSRNRARHRNEVIVMSELADAPHVVGVLGYCKYDVVTEFFDHTLDGLIFSDADISESEIYRMALETAQGIQALHTLPDGAMVHADLQPRQMLLDDNGTVLVNDLNRGRLIGHLQTSPSLFCPFQIASSSGTWRAPEEFEEVADLTEKIDIYSLGLIFWSMLSRREPFTSPEGHRLPDYKDMVREGRRPYIDSEWNPEFAKLIQDMWSANPNDRPWISQVVERLEAIQIEYHEEGTS